MSVPLQVQLFDSFLGSAEGIHSVIMPDVFSSGGSKNLWIDKYGRAKRILGYSKQNSTAVTTDTGASATRVRALFPYRKTSGGSVTRQLIGVFDDATDEYELWYSTDDGATWTFIADLGASSIDTIPDFAQMGDDLSITNGVMAARTWNGTTLSTSGGTQSPTITSAVGTSGNLSGNYKWKLVSIEADGSRHPGSVASSNLLFNAERASLTWTLDADTDVVGYEVYRTTGTGEVYYFVSIIDGRATASYTDNYADLAILENRILEEHGDAPPTGTYFCEPHGQRMWYLRTDTDPQTAYWSDPGDPDSVLTVTNFLTFKDAETQGDVITGAKGDFEGRLVVFQERSVWTVSGTGEVIGNVNDWTRTRTNAQTGSVSHKTVVRVPAGSKYTDQNGKVQTTATVALAYLTPLPDIRLFDGDNDLIISHPIKDTLAELNYEFRAKAFALHDPQRSEVVWVYPDGSNGEPSTSVVWNYRWGLWYIREWGFSCAAEMDSLSDADIHVAGESDTATGGYVYKLWSGNSFDGASFKAQWMTKTLYGINEEGQPNVSHRKRWRWADFLFEVDQTVTLTVEWVEGDAPNNAAAVGSATFSPATSGVLSASGDTVVSYDSDALVVGGSSTGARVQLKHSTGALPGDYMHHRGLRLRIYDDAQVGSWSLEAFNLAYQTLPGLHRTIGAF